MERIIVRSERIYEGKVFRLMKETVILENGVTTDMEIIRHPGAAAIVPILDDERFILIRQYRHAVGCFMWEIPAGTVNQNETPIMCAQRELTEETGYSSDRCHKLSEIIPVPGYSNEHIDLYIATNLTASAQNLNVDEVIKIHTVRLSDALAMIYAGEIQDGKTICGLLLAMNWLSTR
ncbi:MAG TPA: NUDIX hydrolase [Deltaproteobacteria bacterium]|nr:NUDIX hydrolase [Deltaproteobacteria bacterium]